MYRSGDFQATTHEERELIIVIAIVGSIFFSYSVAQVTTLVTDHFSRSEIDLVTRLSHIQSYLDFRIADPDCKRKVMSYYSHAYRQTGKLFDEALILSELPRPLRERLLQVIGRENLEKMPFMTGMADACVGELFIRFSHYTFDRGMLALLQHVCPRA